VICISYETKPSFGNFDDPFKEFLNINPYGRDDSLAVAGDESEDETGDGENFGLRNKPYMDMDSSALTFKYNPNRDCPTSRTRVPRSVDPPPTVPRMTGVGEVPGR
jgi:hypothetical protein